METDEQLHDHALRAYILLERVRRQATKLAADPSLESPEVLRNHLQLYKRWGEMLSIVEWYPIPFLERFTEADRRLTALTSSIAEELGWQLPMPLVGGFSSQYFWTKPEFGLICVPTGEGFNLLALPDLLHEIGHILLMHHRIEFFEMFLGQLESHFKAERRRVEKEQRAPRYKEVYQLLFALWRDRWIWEFAADMVATYLVGAPFGWQHIRLCASSGQPAYYPAVGETADHPSDEARMRGVIAVLQLTDGGADAVELRRLWQYYLNMSGDTPPLEYEICYPQSLIDSLAKEVVHSCKKLGLHVYQNEQSSNSIRGHIKTAWIEFMESPDRYVDWESETMKHLWLELGLEPE